VAIGWDWGAVKAEIIRHGSRTSRISPLDLGEKTQQEDSPSALT